MKYILFLLLLLPGIVCCDLKEQLFAVHATDELPDDGLLHAGYGKEVPENWMGLRTTVHFSLGELVRPIGKWMSWEKKKYAIVTPLKTLLPQLLNLNCYDSFIVGDLELTEETFLVVPVGDMVCASPCVLWEYDASTMSLRQAIDQLIASQGGWKVTMSNKNKDEKYLPAYVDGSDINSYEFFSPLLEELPHLSLGLRWESLHGEAWRLANLEMCLMRILQQPDLVQDYTWQEIQEHIEAIKRAYLENSTLSDKSKTALKDLVELCEQIKQKK